MEGEDNAGKPQLPVKTFNLLLPKDASAVNLTISVNSEEQLPGSFYIYPVQMTDDASEFTEPVSAIYNSSDPFQENYIIKYYTNG